MRTEVWIAVGGGAEMLCEYCRKPTKQRVEVLGTRYSWEPQDRVKRWHVLCDTCAPTFEVWVELGT